MVNVGGYASGKSQKSMELEVLSLEYIRKGQETSMSAPEHPKYLPESHVKKSQNLIKSGPQNSGKSI